MISDSSHLPLHVVNDPQRRSWLTSANAPDCDFPLQNLPFGIFSDATRTAPRVGVALGDQIVDLAVLQAAGLLQLDAPVFAQPSLNPLIALGRPAWRALRAQLSALLEAGDARLRDAPDLRAQALLPMTQANVHLPVEIPGYTDFYSSKEHATNVGSMFRDPKNALLPNWTEMPIGYNGRASSVIVSGTPVRRPNGQLKLPEQERPIFGACRKLDIELETGFIIGVGNPLGTPITVDEAEAHIFGMVLLNDWSARDIQQWEYVPLGPFNAKTFATSISPWVVTLDALEPFRVAQPQQAPQPLPYLRQQGAHAFDIALEARLQPADAAQAHTIARTNFKHLYWSMAQQLAHHTVSGCNTRVGDLMGSGTISGTEPDAYGSLLELTWNGQRPLQWEAPDHSGAVRRYTRSYIADGDTLTLAGACIGQGYRIGFGEVSGVILPAHSI